MLYIYCMKFRQLALVFILLPLISFGAKIDKHQSEIDSLFKIVKTSEFDTSVARAYLDLSEILYLSDLDTVVTLCKKAAKIANSNLEKQISEQEEKSFLETLSGAYNNIGFIYDDKGDIINALKYYNKSLKIREDLNDKEGIAVSLNNIGVIYIKQEQYKQALDYYQKSLKVKEGLGDKKSIATSYNNIAAVYKFIDKSQALEYYTRSLVLREEIGDEKGIAVSLNNIATLYKSQNKLTEALTYYKRALDIREKIGDKRGISNTLSNLGSVALMQGNASLAKSYGERALEEANELGYTERVKDAANLLSQAHASLLNWELAYEYRLKADRLRDSLVNDENKLELIKQKAAYDLEKLQQEKELVEKEKDIQELKSYKNKILAFSFILAFLLALAIIVMFYRGNKKKDVINQLLEKEKNEVEKKNEEKNALLKEIHHRVKNSLQVISSLLRLQSYEFDDDYIRMKFEEAQGRVISIAKLHEQMYNSENLKEIAIKKHFTPLIEELVKDYQIKTKVCLDVYFVDVSMGSKTLIPLGLIINEVISNSFKYAFEGKESGNIKVHVRHKEAEQYILEIGDDGVGMSRDFNIDESSSLGMQLIQVFTEQLNGTLERLPNQGTYFRIEFEDQVE